MKYRVCALLSVAMILSVGHVSANMATYGDVDLMIIDSAPPELMYESMQAPLDPSFMGASKTISGVPAATWWYGCSATSAGMLFGYYDQYTGAGGPYSNMFAGTISGSIDTGAERNIIATQNHIDDYAGGTAWEPGPPEVAETLDAWEANGWTEHTWATCTADYMGTNQFKWDLGTNNNPPAGPSGSQDGRRDSNEYGSTLFWNAGDGARLYDHIQSDAYGSTWNSPQTAGCHGLKLFTESRGYQIYHDGTNYQNYNQYIVELGLTYGFSYDDYKAEIDADRPVMIHVEGHTMLGFGYNDDTTNEVILYDTWDTTPHQMTWGSSYTGRAHRGVTVVHLAAVPEPGTLALMGFGILGLALARRRKNAA